MLFGVKKVWNCYILGGKAIRPSRLFIILKGERSWKHVVLQRGAKRCTEVNISFIILHEGRLSSDIWEGRAGEGRGKIPQPSRI